MKTKSLPALLALAPVLLGCGSAADSNPPAPPADAVEASIKANPYMPEAAKKAALESASHMPGRPPAEKK